MTRFHRWFGIALTIIFLATGQYMRFIAHVSDLAMGPRLLYRSRHIYVLMAALINLVLGAYVVVSPTARARMAQRLGSALIVAGSVLLVVSFFYDAPHANLVTLDLVFSRWGIIVVAAGTVTHALAGARRSSTPVDTRKSATQPYT
jgi:hypothetical protein